MKNIYAIGLGVVFFGLTICISGQSHQNELTGVSTQSNSLKSTTVYDLIRLKIENEYVYDATVIYYYESFLDAKGPEDSDKMFNSSENIPEIFTRIGNSAMAINGFSALEGKSYVSVPVSVRNRIWNECEISSSLEDFTDEYDVVLEDKEEGHYVNLRKSSYTYTPSVLGVEDDRFVLHLTKKANVSTNIFQQAEEDKKSGVDCVSGNGELFVNIEVGLLSNSVNRGEIEIFNRFFVPEDYLRSEKNCFKICLHSASSIPPVSSVLG
jgi:hypothetical protein